MLRTSSTFKNIPIIQILSLKQHKPSMIRITNKFLPNQTKIKPPSSREYPKVPTLSIVLAGCERITRLRNPCLFILIQAWRKYCRYSLLHTLKKGEDQNEIEWLELERVYMRNENSKGSTRKAHSNTDEDHHRQLYENRLLYQLFWHRQQVCKALEQSSKLHETLWNQFYHVCCIHSCKKSLCCELAVLKELKCMLGGSIDFDPLKSRVINHFCHYMQLQDPLVKLETIASIDSISNDLDDLLNHFCILSSQKPLVSEKHTNFGHTASKFDIDPEYVAQFFKEDEEKSEDEKSEYWQSQLLPDFGEKQRRLTRIKEGNNIYFVLNVNDMYEEMQDEYDQMYN